MESANPTWQGIPVNIKEDIVKSLDYKSRFHLKICSKTDKQLVKNSPFYLNELKFRLTRQNDYSTIKSELVVKSGNNTLPIRDNANDRFVEIFKKKKSHVDKVVFDYRVYPTKSDEEEEQLKELISKMSPNFKIRAKELELYLLGLPEVYNLEIFKLVDPSHLTTLIMQKSVSRGLLERLTEFPAWENLKEFKCYQMQDISIDWILHIDKIKCSVIRLQEEDVDKLIRTFISKQEVSRGMGFSLECINLLDLRKIPCLNYSMVNGVDLSLEEFHTQTFQTSNKDLIFFLRISQREVKGYFCKASNPYDDFHEIQVCHNTNCFPYRICRPRRCLTRRRRLQRMISPPAPSLSPEEVEMVGAVALGVFKVPRIPSNYGQGPGRRN